ncbi:MAG: DUF5320 domain-containing protein [Bacteroidales bacterium]|nr:DUF5320 domain-containing protein [Bacteroidales bacterium]
MPRGDRTGPAGNGPMTGRQMGYCAGNNQPGFVNSGYGSYGRGFGRGRGFGIGRGLGYGRGFGYYNYPIPQYSSSNKEALKNEINALKEHLSFLEKQLSESKDKDQS